MKIYRIAPQHYLENYSGLGASYKDGARWNKPGFPVLYFACSPSVAMLEMGNYLPSPRFVPQSYRLAVYDFPDDLGFDELSQKELPEGWDTYPHSVLTQDIGTRWLAKGEKLALKVPSAAVPLGLEQLMVVNPNHPSVKKIQLLETVEKIYSDRLFDGV